MRDDIAILVTESVGLGVEIEDDKKKEEEKKDENKAETNANVVISDRPESEKREDANW